MSVNKKNAALILAEEIRDIRIGRGLTQQEFADNLGAAMSSVQKWEAGAVAPHRGTLKRIRELGPDPRQAASPRGGKRRRISLELYEDLYRALDVIVENAPSTIVNDIANRLIRRAMTYGFEVEEMK